MGMAITKPLIIMALYDIGRDNWKSFDLSYNTYLWWMKNTLSLQTNIVIYTEEKFAQKIKEYREEFDPNLSRTKIVIQPIEQLECYKLYQERLSSLMGSDEFKKKIHLEVPEMNQPLYNVIMFNKLNFIQDAKNNNYFDNDLLIWADEGGLRDSIDDYKNEVWPSLHKINQLDNSKVTFFSHSKNIIVRDKEYHALSQIRFIQGTAFFVPTNCVDQLTKEFNETIEECLSNRYIGSDEKIFDITYCKNRDAYNLIKCDWRTYFKIFKDDGTDLFDKNGNQANKALIDLGGHECQGLSRVINELDADKSWEIHTFEPNPLIKTEDFAKELENHKIKVHKKAVWKRTGKTIFNQYGPEGKSQGSLLEETDGGKGYGDYFSDLIVPCVDLLEFVRSIDNSKEIYIKMDIEWSEYEVLEHMLRSGWPKNIKKIWVQWHGTNDEKKVERAKQIEKKIKDEGTELQNWL
jgi:FkbM family methyltransferase